MIMATACYVGAVDSHAVYVKMANAGCANAGGFLLHGEYFKSSMQQALQRALALQAQNRLGIKHAAYACVVALLQKEEELERLQAELHSLLAGVSAARHEQQQQQRLLAQLHHQHEDAMQVTHCHLLHCCTPPCQSSIAVFLHVIPLCFLLRHGCMTACLLVILHCCVLLVVISLLHQALTPTSSVGLPSASNGNLS